MVYLYGDSTPSPLRTNFLELLREAIDVAVHCIRAGQVLDEGREKLLARQHAAQEEVGRLEALDALVAHSLAGAHTGEAETATARCVATIARTATELVHKDVAAVRAELSDEAKRTEARAAEERDGCLRVLASLLLKHDLPGTIVDVSLRGEGERYKARLHGMTTWGFACAIDLEVPEGHLLSQVIRVERLVEKLEVEAPELSGWLQKTIKVRPQKLERYFIAGLSSQDHETTLRLRQGADASGEGFDAVIAPDARCKLLLIGDQGEAVADPFDLSEADAGRLSELCRGLLASAHELGACRKALVDARLDGKSVRDLAKPTQLAEKLIEVLAPIVDEIEAHSMNPRELVIKRLLSDDRREEIFISRTELFAKLEGLTPTQQTLFAPLGLGPQGPTTVELDADEPSEAPASPPGAPIVVTMEAEPSRGETIQPGSVTVTLLDEAPATNIPKT